ncbi:MAG: hypothetical protein CFE43_18260 [Burkholderiales bacterium PBB3]|nr:MAG: hypothetical protein CFE43_18260 [Burkholderiales bacterium PBB3]
MPVNHYDTLEVSPKASAEVIRAAYKSLMQRHHPDKQADATNNSNNNNERATHIAQAYAVLSDPGQRAAYDQTLSLPSLPALSALPAHGVAVPARAGTKSRRPAPSDRKAWYVWYAWGLIATILVAGGVILTQSKKRADARPPLGDVRPGPRTEGRDGPGQAAADPLPLGTAPALTGMPPPETPAQLQARTVMPYALDLSVDLPPAKGTTGNSGHVLTIAELGLRVAAPEPLRWVEKIQTQRQDILRQILVQLASARAEELTKPEADLYLKGMIASTVAKAIGLPTAAPPAAPPVDPTQLPVQPIEVLLPQGFRLR